MMLSLVKRQPKFRSTTKHIRYVGRVKKRFGNGIEKADTFDIGLEGVRMRGLEPPRDYLPLEPESSASTNSATSADSESGANIERKS